MGKLPLGRRILDLEADRITRKPEQRTRGIDRAISQDEGANHQAAIPSRTDSSGTISVERFQWILLYCPTELVKHSECIRAPAKNSRIWPN